MALTAGAAQALPPVWTVKDADSELLIFGSVHSLPPGLDWRPPALTSALKTADDLWFEISTDTDTQAEVATLAGAKGVLPPGQSLFKLIPTADGARLLRVAKLYGVNPASLDRFEPWLAEVVLATSVDATLNKASAEQGVEKSLAAAAPPAVRRRSLETPAEQIGFFDETPMPEQIVSLRDTLREIETNPRHFEVLVQAWLKADLRTIEREALAPMRRLTPGLYRRVVTDRNARWTKTLQDRLAGAGRTVVVGGVGHLVGSDGLPERLSDVVDLLAP